VLQAIADVVVQLTEANKTETDARKRLQGALAKGRKRLALMHARAVCLAARSPLPLVEIERRIRADGYVTRAQNFGTYLRRVLRTSGQFQESSPGGWAFI